MRRFLPLTLFLSLSSCWGLAEDDAGDRAFVQWATTAILGRGPVSTAELNALLALEAEHGREALLDVLMQQPEFVEHWDDLLMHQLRVRTESASADKEACYTEGFVPDSYDWALSNHLRTADWSERFCVDSYSASDDLTLSTGGRTAGIVTEYTTGETTTEGPSDTLKTTSVTSKGITSSKPKCFEFTMKDVIRASLRTDRMDALLRARIAPLAAYDSAVNARRTMFDSYFNRHQDCMECHTTTYSTTDGVPRNENWDRYFPAVTEVDLEFSSFWTAGPNHGADNFDILDGSLGGDAMQSRFRDMFTQIKGTEDAPGVKPWGFDERCVQDGLYSTPQPDDDDAPNFAGWGDQTGTEVRILDFVNAYDDGLRALVEGDAARIARTELEDLGDGAAADFTTCNTCHGVIEDALPLDELTGTMTAARIHLTVEKGSPAGLMEGGYAQDEALDHIVANLVADQVPAVEIYADPTVGMAHLTALTFVDDVAKHLSGQSLTLEHGFPRNADQAYALRTLADVLVENDWSLRAVIKTIALSELVNRNAPVKSSTDPYILPMVFDPWQDTPEDGDVNPLTGVASNGQGDLVHRWPVATLIRKRNAALGWSQPTHFDDEALQADLGSFVAFDTPGFSDYTMASALAWETNHTQDGTDGPEPCTSPYGDDPDVIDTLADPAHNLTLTQALKALKFRLLGDDYLWADRADGLEGFESNRIAEIWGVEPSDDASAHADVLRDYCAVLLASPQFVLAGVPTDRVGVSWTDPDIPCMDDECFEGEWCERYRQTAVDLGYRSWDCYEPIDDLTLTR